MKFSLFIDVNILIFVKILDGIDSSNNLNDNLSELYTVPINNEVSAVNEETVLSEEMMEENHIRYPIEVCSLDLKNMFTGKNNLWCWTMPVKNIFEILLSCQIDIF